MDDKKLIEAKTRILENCGDLARQLLDPRHRYHRYLTPKVLKSLGNKTPQRQRSELEQVAKGNRPFTTKSVVFDTLYYGKVPNRLGRAAGWVNKANAAVQLAAKSRLSPEETKQVDDILRSLEQECSNLWRIVRKDGKDGLPECGRPKAPKPKSSKITDERIWTSEDVGEATLARVVGYLNLSKGFVSKCLRDLPRARHLPRTREQVHSAGVRLFAIQKNIWAMTEALGRATDKLPGTRQKRVATHIKPDVDALVSVWLVERFLVKKDVEVIFVPYDHDWSTEPSGVDYVVDMGYMYDPRWGLFDHKEPSFADRQETCAALLIWEHLVERRKGVARLNELVHTVHAGDSIRLRARSSAYSASKENGVHACLDRLRKSGLRERGLYIGMREWLDTHWL